MAGTAGEEEIQDDADDGDPSPHCAGDSASLPLPSLQEDQGSSAMPERLSVLSSKAIAQARVLAGPEVVSGDQAQRTTSGLAEHHPEALSTLYSMAVGNLHFTDISSLYSGSPFCNGDPSLEVPHHSGLSSEPLQIVPVLHGTNRGGHHMQQAGNDARVIWTKTAQAMETLENKKKEEKEKYRLQLAMYRRLLLLRSIRSLHGQLEQQQARLQRCYGTLMQTRKEVLKHLRSTSPSP